MYTFYSLDIHILSVKKRLSLCKVKKSQKISVKLICGNHFDCFEWNKKYTQDDICKYAKCVRVYDEVYLVASNKNDEVSNKKKNNTLSCGAISNIIIDE